MKISALLLAAFHDRAAQRTSQRASQSTPRSAWRLLTRLTCVLSVLTLVACSSGPKAPQWRVDANSALESLAENYLKGRDAVAKAELQRARREASSSAQAEALARVELNQCALERASLVEPRPAPCTGFAPFAAHVGPAERAYARLVAGERLSADEAAVLPADYQGAAALLISTATPDEAVLQAVSAPLPRLLTAASLLAQQRLNLPLALVAVQTASEQGWRRPLLAWLGVAARLAEQAGDAALAAQLRQRMDWASGGDGRSSASVAPTS